MVCFFLIQRVFSWSISSVPQAKLRDERYNQFIRDTLARDGLFVVTDISPHFAQASDDAFTAFANCTEQTLATTNSQGVFSSFVPRRRASASQTGDVADFGTSDDCDMQVARTFRSLVHQTGVDVARALSPQALEFIKAGAHREQFHRYRSSDDQLPMHTDAGVLLAMTSKVLEDMHPNTLAIVSPLGDHVRISIPPNSILIMAGESFNMAREMLGSPLRAVPHAPVIPANSNSSRLWYGQMYLPNEDFYIRPNLKMRDWLSAPDASSIGCLTDGRRLKDARVPCGPNTSLCWMQCIPETSICRNITSGGTCESAASLMHPNCHEERESSPPKPFCTSEMSVNMFMQGFVSVLFGDATNGCLLFFFQSWTIDSYFKFVVAFLSYMGIAISSEALIYYRRRKAREIGASRGLQLLSYAGNVTLGYIVMLGAMTYAIEVFLATVLGLTVGHALFGLSRDGSRISAVTACCARGAVTVTRAPVNEVCNRPEWRTDDPLSEPLMEQLVLHVEGNEDKVGLTEETISGIEGVTECFTDCCQTSRMIVHTNGNVSVEDIRNRLADIDVRCRLPI